MPKPVVSTETSSHPLTRFTAQSRRDRLGELRRRSLPATSPRSQPTDTVPSPTDALRELVPDRVESLKKPPPAIGPLVGAPEPRRQACTLSEAPPPLCRRPDCRRPFIPRAAGSQQKFCSKSCRMAFHREARQVGYRMVNAPGLRPDRRAPARRTRPSSFWRSGVDVATGRRVPISIMSPSQCAGPLAEPSSHPLTRFTAQSLRNRLGERRRLSIPATSPRSQPTDTASSPRHPDAPTPGAAS